jgi:uncharacterized protein YjbJ (UPF0337 family)
MMTKKDKARNTTLIAKGKFKRVVGEATGGDSLEATGNLDQVKGNIKQASERVKDAFKE